MLRRNKPHARDCTWDLPGGLVEPGEGPKAALVREVSEETGVAIEIIRTAGKWNFTRESDGRTVTVSNYECVVAEAGPSGISLSHEHTEFGWFGLDEIASLPLKDPSLLELLLRAETAESDGGRQGE